MKTTEVAAGNVVTSEVVVETVVIAVEEIGEEIGKKEAVVVADLRLKEAPKIQQPPRNNSQRLKRQERRRAQTDKVKCE